MKNVATKLSTRALGSRAVFEAMGTVVRVEGDTFVVRTDDAALGGAELRCKRAFSCLVEPSIDDYVLVGGRDASAWILSILERESKNAQLSVEGDLDLRAGAKVRVVAQEGVDVVTAKDINMMGNEIGLQASRAKVFASEILAIGSEVIGELANVKLRGTFFDKVFERVSERVQRSFRRVEEIDQLKAKQMDYVADETLSLRSENMVATAQELVKVDGEQIHFG